MLHLPNVAANPFLGLHGENSPLPHHFGDGLFQRLSGALRSGLRRVIARSFALPNCTPPRRPSTAHPQIKARYYR